MIFLPLLALVTVVTKPAQPTTPAQLDALAVQLNAATAPDPALDKAVLTALREPARTLYNISLPSSAAQYTTNMETALKLQPPGWRFSIYQAADGNYVGAMMHDGAAGPGWLDYETYGYTKGGRAVSITAGIVSAWAWELRQRGR